MSQFDYRLKVVLTGDSSTGKTSLLNRYVSDTFDANESTTIGVDFRVKHLEHHGTKERVKLTLFDTAGQERFRTVSSSFYRGAHGVILVYDVTNRESFASVEYWLKEVDRYSSFGSVVKCLIGNKKDLKHQRRVQTSEGEALAREHGMMFIEASARTAEGVERVFEELVYKVLDTGELANSAAAVKTGVTDMLNKEPGSADADDNDESCCW